MEKIENMEDNKSSTILSEFQGISNLKEYIFVFSVHLFSTMTPRQSFISSAFDGLVWSMNLGVSFT